MQAEFPNFSWRGYAGFSQLQDEVISMDDHDDDDDFDEDDNDGDEDVCAISSEHIIL